MSVLAKPDDVPEVAGVQVRTLDRRKTWVILCLDGALIFVASLFWLAQGRFFSLGFEQKIAGSSWRELQTVWPDVAGLISALVRIVGAASLMASMLIMGVSATSFRRGEAWAWYVMWSVPFYALLHFSVLLGYQAVTSMSFIWDGVVFATAILALMAPDAKDEDAATRAD